ncbi:MAG: hypothetical protein K2J30_01280 [Clostridia bacterium]|nr:hypothetical protein [Clostridia bacterium]
MKKLHLAFGIIAAVITLAALVFAIIYYVRILRSPLSSIPPEAAFEIVGIFYALALAVWGIAWLTAWLILRRRACKKQSGVL